MGVLLPAILQLVKLCIIVFALTVQGSIGYAISPSPATLPSGGTSDPSYQKGSWRTVAPSSPAVPNVTLPPPTSAPIPQKGKEIEPVISPSPSNITLSPLPSSSTVQGHVPPRPPQRNATTIRPPVSTPAAPVPVALPPDNWPKTSPVSQPTEPGSLSPSVHERSANNGHTTEPVSSPPVGIPSPNLPKNSPDSQPTELGSFSPNVHKRNANKSHTPEPVSLAPVATPSANWPNNSPVSQPIGHGSLPPNVNPEPLSPAPVAIPSSNLPKVSPVNQPTEHGSSPPIIPRRGGHKGHTPEPVSPVSVASPPWKVVHKSTPGDPILPTIAPSILPEPVTPPSAFPVNPPSDLPEIPGVSPSILPAPVVSPASTPSRSFNWTKGGAPVAAPAHKTSKPLPAVIHPPAQAPAAHKADHAAEPSISSPKEYLSPASSPSTSFNKHHHTRNIITSPAPASSYLVSSPPPKHRDKAIPPSSIPSTGRTKYAPPPMNPGSSVSPISFPNLPPLGQVSPVPSPSVITGPRSTKIPFHPPKISPSSSSSESPKMPVPPRVQALPPPPPNEDCLSTVCTEPLTNSPPGSPCACVLPMKVGLRLSISLYTFFPLVSELAFEIASGVFMKQSQVRIMGATAASQQQPEKTDVLIDLVPLGEDFDNTTAFLTSDRFWHKQVAIKASYFGDYDVLYVSYPGLPPSPPLPPSSISMIDGGPYSTDGSNGRSIKPLGVDIQKRHRKGGLSSGVIAIIALSVFVAVVLCSAAVWVLLFKCRDHVDQAESTPQALPPVAKTPGTVRSVTGGGTGSASSSFQSGIAAHAGSAKTFSMNDIERATDNFHASRILGEGGFGRVYSGILEDGTKVAVKVLKREDHHGNREFFAEVEMLSRLHHRNLVKLIGICAEDSFRCLVYELIPNGSVESHLHGVDKDTSPLDWGARLKIALGAARGLAYLHEDSSPRVIHRDFKSSNILLEDDFTPKVSDFGLARTATDEESRHISTRVMGTFGYVAPEYAMTGHLLVKSDVYSYGVVLLELLTGRKPVDMSQPPGQENLVALARPLLTSKEGLEMIMDQSLAPDVPFDSVAKVAAIASMCVQPEVSNRPFMGEVVQALKLVCNECDEAQEAGSRSSSQENLSVDLDVEGSTVSAHLPDNFRNQYSAANYDTRFDIEQGLSASELFSSSARIEREVSASGSFRRHSYSGPLRTGRSRRLWQIIRSLSRGSVSEHGIMGKL
ncbi:hypothetical protein L6164_013956 [Bauhinia variegata]|uniref:Uncharacterized protein n=1 Tax=Bauhinia variegata TaxID=167791 RepID=A0ACB9NGR2_BAUVA|nr:hypothetical protein L6164_013956 [Bauhinia variegata]